jgi:hypothetical protein
MPHKPGPSGVKAPLQLPQNGMKGLQTHPPGNVFHIGPAGADLPAEQQPQHYQTIQAEHAHKDFLLFLGHRSCLLSNIEGIIPWQPENGKQNASLWIRSHFCSCKPTKILPAAITTLVKY